MTSQPSDCVSGASFEHAMGAGSTTTGLAIRQRVASAGMAAEDVLCVSKVFGDRSPATALYYLTRRFPTTIAAGDTVRMGEFSFALENAITAETNQVKTIS